MTPKEKAKELYNNFSDKCMCFERGKQCALIAVDEILKNDYGAKSQMNYWQEVKQEINNL